MIETRPQSAFPETPSALDVAAYVGDISAELARIAGEYSLPRLAAALELSQSLAAEAVAALSSQSLGKAAPDDAA